MTRRANRRSISRATTSITSATHWDDANEARPHTILSADRSLSGFEFSGLYDNTACYTINNPPGGQDAKWDSALCHGVNAGNVGFTDGSVQQLTDSRLVSAILNI